MKCLKVSFNFIGGTQSLSKNSFSAIKYAKELSVRFSDLMIDSYTLPQHLLKSHKSHLL